MQKFTPRLPTSTWSEPNKIRVKKLISEGKMTKAGMKCINIAKQNGKWDEVLQAQMKLELSADLMHLLKQNTKAFSFYSKLAPSHKKNYVNWVMSAKKPETRLRRCKQMIGLLEKEQKPGMI